MSIDNESYKSISPRRFYLQRIKDETGVSSVGRVLEGVLWQDGKVTVQWRPPLSSITIYNSWKEFMTIHVDCHPSCNQVIWVDCDYSYTYTSTNFYPQNPSIINQ